MRCIGDTLVHFKRVLFLIFDFLVVFILLTSRAVASRYNDTKSIGSLMVSGQAKKTPRGKLAPLETSKAVAFQKVIEAMENHLGKSCWQLTGQGQADFTKSTMS